MRIAVAGFSHETNTYADASRGTTPYEAFTVLRGQEIVEAFDGVRIYVGGFLEAARELGAEVVGTYWAGTDPSGSIGAHAYERIRAELFEALEAAAPFDAIALEIHGAAVVEGTEDPEGDLATQLRDRFPNAVLVAAGDLHGNMTDVMAEKFHLALGVELYPHTDMYERGFEAVSLLPSLLDGSLIPTTYVEHLPMLLPPTSTDAGLPGAQLVEQIRLAEAHEGVVDCTIWHGFPFTDIADVGVHVAVTTRNDPQLAESVARGVASWIWEHRETFRPDVLSPADAIAAALQSESFPVVINETSDNPGAGTPGDGTHLLRAMLEAELTNACFGFICDPAVVEAAVRAGVGATVECELGGKTDDLHGKPLIVSAYVKTISDGNVMSYELAPGFLESLGRMVRLRIQDIDVVVSERSGQTYEPEVFLAHGIDVRRMTIVGLKGSNHFRAGFSRLAGAIITADSPGLSTLTPEFFVHTRATRPMWPTHEAATYN